MSNAWTSWPTWRGCKPQIAAITERAMRGEAGVRGRLRERVGMLKGLTSALEKRL